MKLNLYRHIVLLLVAMLFTLMAGRAMAAIETHSNYKKGAIHAGDTLSVTDDKFTTAHWLTLRNLSVTDVISFRMLDSVYMNYTFTTNIQLRLQYYTDPSQTSPYKDTTINLSVNYSPGQGTTYKGLDTHSFSGAYRILLTVISISSPQIGSALPASYQLGASMTINRKYNFSPGAVIAPQRLSVGAANQLHLFWNHPEGAEEFDVEWTTVNNGNPYWGTISAAANGTSSPDDNTMNQIFRNNSSRLTTPNDSCTLSMLSNDSFILVRIRQVQDTVGGFRMEGDWNYKQVGGTNYAIWPLNWNEPNLNWQYSAAFAEEGKKKEVISYFDGSLRGRQTVTINNTDNVGVAQENVYDEFGRAAASILPAPFADTTGNVHLHYVKNFNRNTTNAPYSFINIGTGTLCEPNPDSLSTNSGASKYYSGQNSFINAKLYNSYIPDAGGYPLSVTQYTADNTGRIKVQGGVGKMFQPGKNYPSYTTKYYYGKPEQWELDQLFGNDVGYAEHYLKNMVMDANGQISISYLNASGKTIATALSGQAPGMLDTLTSYSSRTQTQNTTLLKPGQFSFDATALKLRATTTYLASVKDTNALLKYNIQTLASHYPGGAFSICSSCYYEMTIKVVNACGDTTKVGHMPVKIGSADTAACISTALYTDSVRVKFAEVGEYYVSFEFALNKNVIEDYVDNFVKKGTANGFLRKEFSFIRPYLDSLDFSGCLGDCSVCVKNLGTKTDFTQMFAKELLAMQVEPSALTDIAYTSWVSHKYDSLKTVCDTLQAHCDMGPCNKVQSEMEQDVSPGGQYALFAPDGTALETGMNVLYIHYNNGDWRTDFPVKAATDTVYYQQDLVTRSDGSVTSPYDAGFQLADMIKYWKPEWAVKFLKYHPEYCKLQFCNSMSTYENWDLGVKTFVDSVAKIPTSHLTYGLNYDHNNADWLLAADPFFKTGAPGEHLKPIIRNDLLNYTSHVLAINGVSNKSLTQFIDYTLYCADTSGTTNTSHPTYSDNWYNCTPNAACRVPEREWQTYRDWYFQIKAKYYDRVRDSTVCNGVCPVGDAIKPIVLPPPRVLITDSLGSGALEYSDIYIDYYGKSKVKARLVNADGSDGVLDHDIAIPIQYSTTLDLHYHWESNNMYDDIPIPIDGVFTTYIYIRAGSSTGSDTYYLKQSAYTAYTGYDYFQNFQCVGAATGVQYTNGTVLCDGTTVNDPLPPPPPPVCTTYANKISRFNFGGGAGDNHFSTDPATARQQGLDSLSKYVNISCVSNADNWMAALMPGLTHAGLLADTTTLRAKLIELCEAGGDVDHMLGASSLKGSTVSASGYHDFASVIKGVLGISTFTPDINPWLISAPPPYAPKAQQKQKTLFMTDTGICHKLDTLTTNYNAYHSTHTSTSFYSYLQLTYGDAMNISAADLAALQNSCNNCRFLLTRNVVEPVFLDPETNGCIVPAEYANAKAYLYSNFAGTLPVGGPAMDTSAKYQFIYANYMNQRYGFALSYDDYHTYDTLLVHQPNALLCNQPPFKNMPVDKYACLETQIAVAAINGRADYEGYIEEQKNLFRQDYVNTCSAAKAQADLRTQTQNYHYTLYYYDQADNLIRTIPPEGVNLLTGGQLAQVAVARLAGNTSCTYAGPTTTNVPLALQVLSNVLSYTGASAIETWLYNPGGGMNHFVETTTDKHWLYQFTIRKNKLGIDIYPMTEGVSPAKAVFSPKSRHYRVTIPNTMLPLADWTHVVVQSASGIAQNAVPQIWFNGVQMTVAASASPLGSFKVSAVGGVMQYPDSLSTLKHMRIYGRLMSSTEIWDNANNNCFMPDAFDNLWYRFNIPAMGGPTTIAANSTVETRCTPQYPDHTLRTTYAYNSTNQVVQQNSPDGGTNRFWYDLLSRLRISQNDKQGPNHDYSYTSYDQLGRITEVGQTNNLYGVFLGLPDYVYETNFYLFNTHGTNSQITHTYYDEQPTAGGGIHALTQNNLRKRVVLSTYKEHQADTVEHATYYNYDLDGNVKTLYQQIAGLGIKQIDYQYDLISGKVNFVSYQSGKKDAFYYQYKYDAENKLTDAYSGNKVVIDTALGNDILYDFKKLDAHYEYYLHGPLARTELGDVYSKVQGIDHAYTLQGWLKGVNGSTLAKDMGNDGHANNIAKDAYAYSLGYYYGDYKPIRDTTSAFGITYSANSGDITGQSLYNGNISNTTLAISAISSGAPVGYTYHYDQLNRLKQTLQHDLAGITTNWTHTSIKPDYAEHLTYDGNGNILKSNRHGNGTNGIAMDSLTYRYSYDSNGRLINNRLNQVNDAVANANGYTTDLKDQTDAANYRYDAIGNLVHDTQAGIDTINWTTYGKIKNIVKGSTTISYTYSPSGQRVSKTASGLITYYVRDAQGNTLAVYDNAGSNVNWKEQHLYGSSRLGIWTPNVNLAGANVAMVYDTVGRKFFELNNHLGNVLATITDKRVQVNVGAIVDYYVADIATAQDYYPGGMQMPGRTYTVNNTSYRYGFNGQEKSFEIDPNGNLNTAEFWEYDARIGRRWNTDPVIKAKQSPYICFSDNPVWRNDPNGDVDSTKSSSIGGASVKVVPLLIPEKLWPNVYKTMMNGVATGQPLLLTYDPSRSNARARRRAALAKHTPAKPGYHLDEYPYASTEQGGAGASVNEVPEKENMSHGGYIGATVKLFNMKKGDKFLVVPVPDLPGPIPVTAPSTNEKPTPSTYVNPYEVVWQRIGKDQRSLPGMPAGSTSRGLNPGAVVGGAYLTIKAIEWISVVMTEGATLPIALSH